MKKLTAILLSAMFLITMAISVSAKADISGLAKGGYTAYPLFDEAGLYTEGVTIYRKDGTTLTDADIQACMGKGWDANALKDANGNYELIVWSNAGHYVFGQGVRLISDSTVDADGKFASPVVEIVFTGTGIRLGTCYRTDDFGEPEVVVEIDGVEVETDPFLLWADWADDTTPTIFFETEGLENTTHTVRVSAIGEVEWDWFEIRGTLGEDSGGDTYVEPSTEPPATNPPVTDPATTETPATEPTATTDAPATAPNNTAEATDPAPVTTDDADTTKPAPANTGLIIAILAVVAVIVVVVIVILKKKK